jgi:alpha-beta hydrolase superfamily lysophospholipase
MIGLASLRDAEAPEPARAPRASAMVDSLRAGLAAMNAPAPPLALDAAYGRPIAFEGLAGFLHVPAAPTRLSTGCLVVPPWGFDGLCMHPLSRRLAADLAAAGLPTLRYDPPGAGHSSDVTCDGSHDGAPSPAGDLAAAWSDSVVAAARALRAETGVRDLVLIGVGLGAASAAAAARRIDGVAGLALLAPWTSGRRALRELVAAARITDEAMGVAETPDGPDGGLSVAGFVMSAAERESVARIALSADDLAAAPARLILARPEQMNAARALAEAAGARLEPFEGYEKAVFDPSNFVMPEAAIAATLAFARAAARGPEAPAAPCPAAPARFTPAAGVTEEAMRFGPGRRLFGVLASPDAGAPRAVVLQLNAGRNRAIGWARGEVAEGRRLARAGVAALRFDLAGVGDSAPDGDDEPLYDVRRAADVAAAIDAVEARFGPLPVIVKGPCSGAFVCFNAALLDARIKGAALINAQRYVWNARDDFDTVMRQPVHTVQIAQRARDPRELLRLFRGEISMRAAVRRLFAEPWRKAQSRLGRAGLGLTHEARLVAQGRRGFDALRARDVALAVIVSDGDRAIDELMLYFGDEARFRAAHGAQALVRVADADHNLTPPCARATAARALDALIARLAG